MAIDHILGMRGRLVSLRCPVSDVDDSESGSVQVVIQGTTEISAAIHESLGRNLPVCGRDGPLRSAVMADKGFLNDDYERRSYWQATMPDLPDRAGRELPDSTDVVVVGGGYAGINAARELATRGVKVTLLEAHTLGFGPRRATAASCTPGTSGAPASSSSATARTPAGRCTRRRSTGTRRSSD